MSSELGIAIAVAVLLGNAFFVGAEFALVSARRSNIELKAANGSRLAKMTLSAMEDVSMMLAGAQLGVTLCSLIFGAVGEPVIAHYLEEPLYALGVTDVLLHTVSFIIALVLMTYIHVVIGEMVPKNISLATSTKAALILVPPLLLSVKAIRPIVMALNMAANGFVRLLGIHPQQEIQSSFNRDEVAGFVKESRREGLLSDEEESLLSGTLGFEKRGVKHVVVPIDKIICTSSNPTPIEIERLSTETGFSRFPVAAENGQLKGYVHVKDILQIADAKRDKPMPARLIRPLGKVKGNISLKEALTTMQSMVSHMIQVQGADGKVHGLVMLEDVLEEIVGPIRDEARRKQ
jgi:CBS domain containing-hemolysin-like protein